MKILQIISSLGSGGAERLVTQLASLLTNDDVQCDVLTLTDVNSVYLTPLRESHIEVLIAPYRNRYDFRMLFFIKRVIRMGNYDIIHAHTFPAIYWTSFAAYCIKSPIKFIMTEHNTYNRRRDVALLLPIEKLVYHRYNRVISISEETQKALMQWLKPKSKSKYLTIENGIDVEIFKEALPLSRASLGLPETSFLLGMIGSFTIQKNHKAIINAMQLLPKNIHIVFAGEGPLLESSITLAETLKVKERTHFLGFRRDVERVMKTVDMVVIPSLWEGFGLVAAEAMACGKPIAASDVLGLREVIRDCGILFDPANPKDIAENISVLYNNRDLFYRCANKAIVRVNDFSIGKMVGCYIEVNRSLCSDACI